MAKTGRDFLLKKELFSVLRRLWGRSAHKRLALLAAKSERRAYNKDGSISKRHLVQYECALCHKHFTADEVQVDHIVPVIDPTTGFVDWNTYIARLFVDIELVHPNDTPDVISGKLQVLCTECHKTKSKQENRERTHVKSRRINRKHTKSTESASMA